MAYPASVAAATRPGAARKFGLGPFSAESGLVLWIVNAAVILLILLLSDSVGFLASYPDSIVLPVADWISAATRWFLDNFKAYTRLVSGGLTIPIAQLRSTLLWLPWPAVIVAICTLAYAAAGWRLALFALFCGLYMAVTGYWAPSMYTLAVVFVAVPISLMMGFLIGVAAFRLPWLRRITEPLLDVMQTMPPFAYLIPILALFGLGPVVGVVATAIYAVPPIVRNTILGLDRVPLEVVESGRMAGSSPSQLLGWVQIPASTPTLLVGVNQTIMAALSMVVITAVLGGFHDIGLEVFTSMKKAQFGESILSGFVIVLMAILMDRISRGFVERRMNPRLRKQNAARRRAVLHGFVALIIIGVLVGAVFPAFRVFPESLVFFPSKELNAAVGWFTRTFYDTTQVIKDATLFFLMLPFKYGLKDSIRPDIWGFGINTTTSIAYWLVVAAIAAIAGRAAGWRLAIGAAVVGLLYFYGTTGIPWLVFLLLVVVPAWQVGGPSVGVLALTGVLFIAATGLWDRAMVSIQLCATGVLISFLIGSTLGVVAALNDRFSAFIRPINDTFQTMPIFVFLIPGVMVFLVGEFTALVSIVLYATVPSIRYTEHGIRSVPETVIEGARICGAGRLQLLRDVQLPLALPEMMLGLNQTIMMGLAMVVVATLVGATGLGQEIMVALTWADVGRGIVAGLAISLIAMVTDRIFQSWSQRKKRVLGLR